MKFLGQGVCLAVVTAGLAALPGLTAQAAPSPSVAADRPTVQKMKQDAKGSVTVTREKATGRVGFARAGTNGDLLPEFTGSVTAKADAFLDEYATLFGASTTQLVRDDQVVRGAAGSIVTYTQEYKGVPVFGAMLRARVDKQGDLTSVNGYAAPGLDLSVEPRVSSDGAADRAVRVVTAEPPGHDGEEADTAGVKAVNNELMVYRTGATAGLPGENKLVYVVEVSNGSNIRDVVFVDANADKVVNRYSLVHDALEREIFEQQYDDAHKVFDEGDGDDPATLNPDQRNIYDGSGEAYWFFRNVFGRDSYDGAGHTMQIVNNDPRISCPNANWNGVTTNYCNGVTSDDVVAHEWGHAYTEYTHGLIYQYQPGALNESYSDIWGETIDLINGRQDEDEGDIDTKRPDGQCSVHTGALPQVVINSPASIAKVCAAGAADFGPDLTAAGLTGNVVVGQDSTDAPGPTTTDACTPLTNAAAVAGKIAIVDRGGCAFTIKVKNVQNAGAVAAIVGNSANGGAFGMAGADPSITIPSVGISTADRNRIVSGLSSSAVNVTLRDASGDTKTESFRWLVAEDSSAFGGAIRDMWTPTCRGDAGKVTDAEYVCGTEDGGGVHSNSGVSNHAYALAVDGGSYNGVDVTGIGLEKAAAIYYEAMLNQTPTTDFEDHADALDAACTAMIGTEVKELTVDPDATPGTAGTIEATDCATIAAVSDAVEFRTPPTQCNYQPMHNQNRPALCSGAGRGSQTVWDEDFEAGIPGDWDADQEVVYDGAEGSPWVATDSAPQGNGPAHPGGVAYGPAPDQGQCTGDASDFSSRDGLISTIVVMPDHALRSPKLSFDHYVATELGFDGGNVKYRLNGGAWQVIPAGAYINNGPRTLATEAQGNTNPMAGEPGFTGTDGGEVTGSWAQSQVDLSMLGVAGGDELEFRFDIGRDGCGGIDGWYIDNVAVTLCKLKSKVAGVHQPEPSKYGKSSQVIATVSPDGSTGTPTGTVRLLSSSGQVMGTATLNDGRAVFSLPKSFPVGRRTMTVEYRGSTTYLPASADVTVTVVRGR